MTREEQSRQLVAAFKRIEVAESELRVAQAEFNAVFGPWAAGRSVSRSEARRQLVSVGMM